MRWALRAARRAAASAIVGALVFYVGLIVLHYQPLVMVTGSMQKTIPVGSLVVDTSVDPASLEVGDVISFEKPLGAKGLDTHRIVAIEHGRGGGLYRTKGDSNPIADPWVLRFDRSVSAHRVVFSVPYAGYGLLFTRSRAGRAMLVAAVCLLLLLVVLKGIAASARREPAPLA